MRKLNHWNTSKKVKARWLRRANRELRRYKLKAFSQDFVRDYIRCGIGFRRNGPYPGEYQTLELTVPDYEGERCLVWYTHKEEA